MKNTDDVMLAHIQSRINTLQADRSTLHNPQARLNELEMMLNVIKAANDLQMLANPMTGTNRLVELDKAIDAQKGEAA